MEIRRNKLRRAFAAAIGIILVLLSVSPALAAETFTVTAPYGEADYSFTQLIQVTEDTPFAGIQFEVTVSDPDAVTIDSFSEGSGILGAVCVPPVLRDGMYMFGFTSGGNDYSGTVDAGEIGIIYRGAEEASVYIGIKILYFPDDGKVSGWLREEEEFAVINITRSTEEPGGDDGPDGGGGGGGGGGGIRITTPTTAPEELPLGAPTPDGEEIPLAPPTTGDAPIILGWLCLFGIIFFVRRRRKQR